ncbi:DNA-dependent RNA polymerase auxiliary subunit epsilon [Virgibacillus halotolerans]|uniref:DNA-dependent RNA polymerase subunit epsilon n=1 Tax=Virgibacillus halotolerans TaxID=1071053 RepID=UPI00196163A3|nr:RNA polymerase epsilon subunit [Virgibacillus halotolerans]MBM7598746.1 DNA-dependent RNA polymerase auxiliary subunit epsilon [Virgibacillus halotolerans]
MVYKVLYQALVNEIPVRERTQVLYVEADSEREVRNKLQGREMNIEFIHELDEAHLNYEKQSSDFKLENV